MHRETELRLIDELLALRNDNAAFCAEHASQSPVARYTDTEVFDNERNNLFLQTPFLAAHHSQLPTAGSFITRDIPGLPLLLTRDDDGKAHAFLNVCRHRSARLEADSSGCKSRFRCPYHAWTYANDGALIGLPHHKTGFPTLEKSDHGLRELACEERYGWLWVHPKLDAELDLDSHLAGLQDDFEWMAAQELEVFDSYEQCWNGNWKIILEGGIESYHFRTAHANTIAPLFHDNLSTYESFGMHLRSVLAKKSIDDLPEMPREQWQIREHSNVLYSLLPTASLLVQPDHIAWVDAWPLAADRTSIRILSLIPKSNETRSEKEQAYWARNHKLAAETLCEDFILSEGIQKGLESQANDTLHFGRFESALEQVHQTIDQLSGNS